jgi:hypothetical protein
VGLKKMSMNFKTCTGSMNGQEMSRHVLHSHFAN